MAKLTAKQTKFIQEYLKDNNATRAAIAAGYSKKTAREIGHQNLTKIHIKEKLDKERAKRAKRVQIDADYVLSQLGDMQKALASDIMDENGEMLLVHKWPEIWQKMVNGIDVKTTVIDGHTIVEHKVKLIDRGKVMKMLGDHTDVQAFKEIKELHVKGDLIETILGARSRIGN